jgi:hypothetical protein
MPLLLLIAGCGGSKPPTVPLPMQSGTAYRVMLKTFSDGAYADQPFHLLVVPRAGKAEPKTVLRAAQCQDVDVGQAPKTLFVFYRELSLTSFASFQYEQNEPRILLCDLRFPLCQSARRELLQERIGLVPICTYRSRRDQ